MRFQINIINLKSSSFEMFNEVKMSKKPWF